MKALGCSSVVQLNMQPPLTVENTTVRAICTYGVPFHRHYPLIRINDTTYFYYRLGEGVLRNFAYTFDIDDTRKVTTFVIIHNHVKTWENGTTYQCYHLDENRLPVNSIIGILIVLKRGNYNLQICYMPFTYLSCNFILNIVSVDNSVLSKVDDSLLTSFTSCFTSSISSNSVVSIIHMFMCMAYVYCNNCFFKIAIRSKDVYSRFQSENNMTQSTLTFSEYNKLNTYCMHCIGSTTSKKTKCLINYKLFLLRTQFILLPCAT